MWHCPYLELLNVILALVKLCLTRAQHPVGMRVHRVSTCICTCNMHACTCEQTHTHVNTPTHMCTPTHTNTQTDGAYILQDVFIDFWYWFIRMQGTVGYTLKQPTITHHIITSDKLKHTTNFTLTLTQIQD